MTTIDPHAPLEPWTPDEARLIVQRQIVRNVALGLLHEASRGGRPKLIASDVERIRSIYGRERITIVELARRYDVHRDTIRNIITRRSWRDVA